MLSFCENKARKEARTAGAPTINYPLRALPCPLAELSGLDTVLMPQAMDHQPTSSPTPSFQVPPFLFMNMKLGELCGAVFQLRQFDLCCLSETLIKESRDVSEVSSVGIFALA